MSKQLTVTVEQLGAALVAWNEMSVTDPDHFDEWDAAEKDDPVVLGEWFADLLVEHGASVDP
jgi:hypothetical protein